MTARIKCVRVWQKLASDVNITMFDSTLTRMDEVAVEVSLWLQLRVVVKVEECSLPEKPTGPNQNPGYADTAGSRHGRPNTMLGSRNVPGLAGETITSAGNRLVHSGFHTGHKPPESGLSKPICVGTGDAAAEGVRPWSRHRCRSHEDLLHGVIRPPLFHDWPWLLPTNQHASPKPKVQQCKTWNISIRYTVTCNYKLSELWKIHSHNLLFGVLTLHRSVKLSCRLSSLRNIPWENI